MMVDPVNKSMRDQELLLRFLALYFDAESYKRPMAEFLNTFMGKNRHLQVHPANQLKAVFIDTVNTVNGCLGIHAFKPTRSLNAAVLDSVMVGMARRLEKGSIQDCDTLQKKYQGLISTEGYKAATEVGTASPESVNERLRLATEGFADVE